jgi:site-specific recombinase XerD
MAGTDLLYSNPNHAHGCHPQSLQSYFESIDLISPHQSTLAALSSFFSSDASRTDSRGVTLQKVFRRLNRFCYPGKSQLTEWILYKYRRGCSPVTLATHCGFIVPFLVFIGQMGKTAVEQISKADLEAYVEHQQDRGLKPITIDGTLRSIYAFIRYLVEADRMPADLLVKKIRIQVPKPLPKAMDPVDTQRFLATIDNIRDRALILVLLRTGMRIGELLNTSIDDLNLAEQKIFIMLGEKNRLGRTVCISDDACSALKAWLRIRDSSQKYLFYGQGRYPLGYSRAREILRIYLEKAGCAHKGYTLHCLRHTFATDLLNAGMRLECLQQLLGHSSLEMTLRYARLTDKTREEEYYKAMARIEKGAIDEHHRLDHQLPPVFEKTQLFSQHS